MKGKRVLVGLSGGVDSSVTTALLCRAGYQVTAVFMRNWTDPQSDDCWLPEYRDAVRVAAHLGIPLYLWDFEKEYRRDVGEYMLREYTAGRTPNPDVLCNSQIKFGVALERAKQLGFDFFATGHYARLGRENRNYNNKTRTNKMTIKLREAKDKNKDQTYFLHQLTQEQLQQVLFPIGEYTKPQVRALARKFKLPTAEKGESMGICFIGEVPMKQFLMDKIRRRPGNIVLSSGEKIGRHEGLSFYTIGQRHGLPKVNSSTQQNQGESAPLFVVAKHFAKNELVVGREDDPLLFQKEILVVNPHWIIGEPPTLPLRCRVRFRHRQPLQSVVITAQGDRLLLRCVVPQRAITAGQFAVFYKDGVCLGGGEIV